MGHSIPTTQLKVTIPTQYKNQDQLTMGPLEDLHFPPVPETY